MHQPRAQNLTPTDGILDYVTQTMELLTSEQDLHGMMTQILERMRQEVNAEAASLFIISGDLQTLECTVCHGPVDIHGLRVPASSGIVGQCLEKGDVIAVRNALRDSRFNQNIDEETGFVTRSILSVPLIVRNIPLGVVQFINKISTDNLFVEEDIRTVRVIAAAGALALHSAKLTHAVLDQERTNRDIAQAAEVQKGLLPTAREPAFPIAGLSFPAKSVSGDFYDFFERPDGRLCFAVGDVSGKGIRAAMIMSRTAGLLRNIGKTAASPGEILQQLNNELFETASMGLFVTLTVGFYDQETTTISLSNAGHEPSFLVHQDGRHENIASDSPPLGIIAMPSPPDTRSLTLGTGTLYLITDGVTEGILTDGAWLGREAFQKSALISGGLDLPHRLAHIARPITFDRAHLRDDVTLLAVSGHASMTRPTDAPPDEPILQLAVCAEAASLRSVRDAMRDIFKQCAFEHTLGYDFVAAIDEACQNIIRHAYGPGAQYPEITVLIWQQETTLITYLCDKAPPIDPNKLVLKDLEDVRPGGLGLHIIQSAMDDVSYVTPPANYGNCLRLERKFSLIEHTG